MPGPSHEQVKALRQRTGAALKQCKEALAATGCNLDDAEQWLTKPPTAPADALALEEAAKHYERIGLPRNPPPPPPQSLPPPPPPPPPPPAEAAAPGGGDIFSGLAVQPAGADTAAADALFASPLSAMATPAAASAGGDMFSGLAVGGAGVPASDDILANPSGMFGGMALASAEVACARCMLLNDASASVGAACDGTSEAVLDYTSHPTLSEEGGPAECGKRPPGNATEIRRMPGRPTHSKAEPEPPRAPRGTVATPSTHANA